jgi:hypothetical protein
MLRTRTVTLNPADVANAQLGIDLPVAYGFVRAQGNEVLNHALASKNRIVIRELAEGEWDGIERLFINSKITNVFDTNLVHFHPGVDGTLGHGLGPDSNGGDQLVDNFWSQLPLNFQPTTFSRKAYIMLNVPPDPAAPSATLTIMGDYRATKVRQFDASGNQTGYAFSTNGAEQCLDVILRTMLKPEWNPSAAAAAGGDLVAAEKARIDWPSFANAVTWCNTIIANGQKRFESSIAFPQRIAVLDALKQLCLMSQLYITEANGRIFICADQPRASTFLLKSDHIVAGTASFDKISLHGVQNRLIPVFNDLNAQGIADIDTIGNSGLSRNGQSVVTVQTKTNHPFTVGQSVQIVPPQDGTTHDSAFDGVFPVTSIPAANKFTYAQGGNANWALWSEDATNAVYVYTNASVVGNNAVDPLGGNTADTITASIIGSSWGFKQALGFNSLNGVPVTVAYWLRAPANVTITLQLQRSGGADVQNVNVNVTTVWQLFTFTHSAVWTGSGAVEFLLGFLAASAVCIVWGLQVADGTGTAYRQTTSSPAGTVSGNGTVGTPESRFAVRGDPVVDHQQHQNAIGQRGLSLTPIFRIVPFTVNLGNNTSERVARILNFQLARNLGINTTPYLAPWSGTVTCFMDAVDVSIPGTPRALISQLCGDIITVDSTVSEEYQGDYEITKATFVIPAADGSGNGGGSGSGQTNAPTIELTLMQYLSAAFSDTSVTAISLRAPIPSGLAPLAQVDSLGVQRLASTKQNNPTNVQSYFTGGNPLSQSGTSSLILVSSFTIQFGFGQISYNSGSVDPGSVGTWFIYCRDARFAGGAVTYFATSSQTTLTAFDDVVFVGQITTTSGGGAHGTGGGGGACFSGNVKVRVPGGVASFDELHAEWLCRGFVTVETELGPREADVIESDYCGEMRDMGNRKLVTPSHEIKVGPVWVPASLHWGRVVPFAGKVYTLHVRTNKDEERHFILEDGTPAHNISPPPQ